MGCLLRPVFRSLLREDLWREDGADWVEAKGIGTVCMDSEDDVSESISSLGGSAGSFAPELDFFLDLDESLGAFVVLEEVREGCLGALCGLVLPLAKLLGLVLLDEGFMIKFRKRGRF